MPTINFNGQEYDNPEAMPPEVRKMYDMANGMFRDSDGDGIPDTFETLPGEKGPTIMSTQFVVDGKSYAKLDDLPPEVRARLEQAMGRFDTNKNGMPDMLEGGLFSLVGSEAATEGAAQADPQPVQPPQLVTMVGEGKGLSLAWLVAIAVIVLLGAAVVVLLLTR